jgi:hypothetical protein
MTSMTTAGRRLQTADKGVIGRSAVIGRPSAVCGRRSFPGKEEQNPT